MLTVDMDPFITGNSSAIIITNPVPSIYFLFPSASYHHMVSQIVPYTLAKWPKLITMQNEERCKSDPLQSRRVAKLIRVEER